jgi:hypothetical protein
VLWHSLESYVLAYQKDLQLFQKDFEANQKGVESNQKTCEANQKAFEARCDVWYCSQQLDCSNKDYSRNESDKRGKM